MYANAYDDEEVDCDDDADVDGSDDKSEDDIHNSDFDDVSRVPTMTKTKSDPGR